MSADNWAVCPWCELRNNYEIANLRAELDAKYGQIPADAFIAARDVFLTREAREMERTLREDYELGVSIDGYFEVIYDGSCTCGFSHKYHKKEPIPACPAESTKKPKPKK